MGTTRERPAWYQNWFPEWRTGPPWVMTDMVCAQPEAAAAVLAQADAAAGLAAELRRHADAGAPIAVVSCGTSEHASQVVADLLDRALGRPGAVEPRQAFDAALEPREGGLCLAISHGGLSKATVAALDAARSRSGRTALITASSAAPILKAADIVLTTPFVDNSWCHTVAYTSPMLVTANLISHLGGPTPDSNAVVAFLGTSLELEGDARRIAAGLAESERVLTAGSGIDRGAARELALKIAEGAQMPAMMLDLENVMHGHLVAHDAQSALVLIVADPGTAGARAERTSQILRATRHIGLKTTAVVSREVAEAVGEENTTEGWLVVPDAPGVDPALAAALGAAVALQLLTLAIVDARGTNPDLLRRDEAPWWEAVAIGETKFPRN